MESMHCSFVRCKCITLGSLPPYTVYVQLLFLMLYSFKLEQSSFHL